MTRATLLLLGDFLCYAHVTSNFFAPMDLDVNMDTVALK